MNEEAFRYSYDLFKKDGYAGSIDDYKSLISSDGEALDYSYQLFQKDGYAGKKEDYSSLIGLQQPQSAPIEQPVAQQPVLPEKKTEAVSYGQFGATGLQRSKDYVPEADGRSPFEFFADNTKSFATGVSNVVPSTLETLAVGQSFLENLVSKTGLTKGRQASEVSIPFGLMNIKPYQVAQEYRDKVEEALPVDEQQKNSFWGQTSTALGEMVPIIASGFTAGGSKILAKEAVKKGVPLTNAINYGKELVSRMGSAQGVLTFSQVAAPSYRQAIEEGATEEQAATYALQNALVSAPIEMLPVQNMFKRLDKVIPGNKSLEVIKRAVIGGTEEAITEGFQNVYENLSANLIYDANKEMLAGIGDATAVGGTVGAILNGVVTALTGKRIKAKSPEEAAVIDEAIKEAEAKIETVNDNNSKIEQTVSDLENTSLRTLNNGATDLEFIENPDGSIELSEDGLTAPDAESKKLLLEAKYPNVEFQVVDNTDKEDPYAESDFTIVGRPKSNAKYSKGGEVLSKNQADFLIQGATTIDELEGLNIENDPELEQSLQSKFEELNVGQPEVIAEQPAIEEPGAEGQPAPEAAPQEPAGEGTDSQVQVEEGDGGIEMYHVGFEANKKDGLKPDHRGIVWFSTDKKKYGADKKNVPKTVIKIPKKDLLVIEDINGKMSNEGQSVIDATENGSKEEIFKEAVKRGYKAVQRSFDVSVDPEYAKNFIEEKTESKPIKQPKPKKNETKEVRLPKTEAKSEEVKPVTESQTKGKESSPKGDNKTIPKAAESEEKTKDQKITQDGKTKQKTTPSKSVKEKSAGGPKKRSGKGRVPLDERQLRGKEAQAAKLTPNTIEESVLSWFVNKGRLSYAGLQSVFGQQKQGGKKNIQGEFNARRSFMRTPEKGGKSIEEIVDEIYNSLPESLTEKADSNPTAIKSAIENAIIENSSIAQMADRLLAGRGVDTKASRQLPPVEERSGFMSDAINQTFTPEEWSAKTAQEKAEFLNEYFDTPAGSEYEYTAEQIEAIEKSGEVINFEQDQREDDIDFLSAMSDEELVEFEKNYKGIEAEFAPEGTKIDAQRQKVKDLADDLIRQIKEDKQGIIVDFEARAKADIKFFNTLRNLVIEYARLKGLQFNEFIADLQKLLGQEIDKKNREYLKTLWDAEKKATPKKNVMTENKSMPYKDQVKQGIAELVASKNRELKIKLERERAKADERVKEAKDKGKEALAQFENIKNTMVEFIKMDLKDIPVDSFTKGELNKILTQINRARTDWSLNLAIGKAYDILGEAGKKKRISVAKEKVSQAKKNIKAGKIGVLQPNSPLDQMLRINPKIIPQRIFDEYESILGEVGARKTVLSPSERSVLFRRVSEVMKEVDKDNSLLNSLKYEYDNFEDKGETYSETLTRMLKEDIISEEEMEFMKLRKSEIQEKQETEKTEPSQEELDEAIDSILNEIPNLPQPGNNFSKDENKIIRFFNSLKEADLQGLTLKDLSSIYSLMGNLENNYVPHLAEKMRQRIEGTRNTKRIKPIIKGFKGKWSDVLSRAKAGIKNKFTSDETTSMRERIRMNPLAYIDQSLRNFKNTEFYDSTYRKLASAYAAFDSDFKTVLEKLLRAESKLKNQFESRAKMMMMAIQEEFESNPGGKVNSAKAWLDATISDQYSIYNSEQKKKLQDLFDSLSTNGEFDLKKAEKSLSKEEKAARKAIEEINNYLTPIADWTATVIRGNRVPIYENYIHLPRKTKGGKAVYDPKTMGGPLNPSTKSGTLEERTGKTHAISFDILDNVLSGAKKTLMDYYMTPVVKEMNQTFSQLEKEAKNESEAEAAIQMSKVYDEVLTGVVGTTMADPNVADAVMSEVMRKGYQSILAGAGKAMSELGTNSAFAGIFKLDATTEGMKILSELKSDKAASVFKNVESSHTSRAYNTSGLDSRHVDFGGYSTKKLSKATGLDEGVTSKLFELAKDNKAYRFIDDIQSGLMSRPDQLVLRPLWMGVFEQTFKKQAGKSPDFDKIASNDQDYMEENAEAIEKSRNEADDVITEAVASSNPFDSIPKNMQKPGANAWGKYINTFNSFMTRFPIYEYNSAVRGVNALMGSGKMSRTDGAKLLTALTTRLMMYDLMTKTVLGFLYQKIAGLFSDQEEEEKEPIENILARPFISSLVMLVLNRNMGNIGKAGINYAVELANKEFGEGITYSGDYDGFSKSVVYPILPTEKDPGDKAWPLTLIENTSASMSPIIKTGFRGMTVAERAIFSKTEEARERNLKELMTRIPFEVAGNLGYIPMYKDFRKILLDYWYNSKEEDEKEKAKDESKRKFGER